MRRRSILAAAVLLALTATGLGQGDKQVLQGKVIDAKGRPLAGATVEAYDPAVNPQESFKIAAIGAQTTGADGVFQFTVPVSTTQDFLFVARKAGMSIGWTDYSMPTLEDLTITLGEPQVLEGVVVDQAGKPVAGAKVRPFLQPDRRPLFGRSMIGIEPMDWFIAETDKAGHFLCTRIPAGARAEFLVSAPGRATTFTASFMTLPSGCRFRPGQKDIRIVLPLEGRIEGTVVRKDDGRPLAGAAVRAIRRYAYFACGLHKPAITDADGRFAVRSLAAGPHVVILMPPPDAPGEWAAEPVNVTVEAGKTAGGVKLDAVKGGVVEILAVDAATGKPIAGAAASFQRGSGLLGEPLAATSAGGITDEKGLLRRRLLPGTWYLGEVSQRRYEFRPADVSFTLEAGKTHRIRVELDPLPRLAGVVTDSAGRAVPGASVTVMFPIAASHQVTITDAHGRFDLPYRKFEFGPPWDVEPPKPRLLVRDEQKGLTVAKTVEEPDKPVQVILKPGLALQGTVTDPAGKPIANAQVELAATRHCGPWGGPITATTDELGAYRMKAVPAGIDGTLWASADGYGAAQASLTTAEGETGTRQIDKMVLPVANLSISGVVRGSDGRPVPKAMVSAYSKHTGPHAPGAVPTGTDGKFTIGKLAAGEYQLQAYVTRSWLQGSAKAEAGASDVIIPVQKMAAGAYAMPSRPDQPPAEDF